MKKEKKTPQFKSAKRHALLVKFKPSAWGALNTLSGMDGRSNTDYIHRLIEAEAERKMVIVDKSKDVIKL